MQIVNIVFSLLFLTAAALQYNDPDPFLWIPLYLFGAFLCYEAAKKRYNKVLYILGFVVYGGYALYLFFDKSGVLSWMLDHKAENIAQSMKAASPWIEETREFFGLIILLIALIINTIWYKRKGFVTS